MARNEGVEPEVVIFPEMVSIDNLQREFKIKNRSTVADWFLHEGLRGFKLGGKWWAFRDDVLAWAGRRADARAGHPAAERKATQTEP